MSKYGEAKLQIVKTLIAVLTALVLAIIIIFLVCKEPGKAIETLLLGPLQKLRCFGNVIELMIPLLFCAVASTIILKTKQYNLAVDGAFVGGGLGATLVALWIELPAGIHPVAAIIFGGMIGSFICAIPAFFQIKYKANVLVTSLMLNYIVVYICVYILNYHLRDPGVSSMSSFLLPATAKLGTIVAGTRIHAGIFLVIGAAVFAFIYLYQTKVGYKLRLVGANKEHAEYSGIKVNKVVMTSQCIAGAIAGIGGAVEILGMYRRYSWQVSPGYGWDGLVIAIMAMNNPLAAILSAFFIAYLRVGADLMAQRTAVESEIVSIIQAIVIVLIASTSLVSMLRKRFLVNDRKKAEKEAQV